MEQPAPRRCGSRLSPPVDASPTQFRLRA